MTIVNLSEFGDSLGTRFLGEEVVKRIRSRLKEDGPILVDLSGVRSVTHSFADEVFGELVSELGFAEFKRSVQFAGANEDIRAIVRFVIAEHLGQAHH